MTDINALTDTVTSRAMSIAGMLDHAATAFGSKACVVTSDRSITFRQFRGEVRRIASWLRGIGIRPRDRVAILDVNSLNFLLAACAVGVAGAILVPLNYRNRESELRYQIHDSGARLLLVSSRYEHEAHALIDDLDLGVRYLDGEAFRQERLVDAEECTFEENSDSPFAICYTSGTSGKPKGAVITQRVAYMRALKLLYELGLRHDDVMHMTTPMFHISCLMLSLGGVLRGSTQIISPQFDVDSTLELIKAHGITFINVVPTILSMILNRPDFNPDMLRGLRTIMYTAAPINLQLLQQIMANYSGDLVQFLGQTEDLPQTVLSASDHRAALAGKAGHLSSVGRPCFGVGLRICDSAGRELPPGEIGEIVTSGGTGMIGYWNLPDATRETLKEGWVASGDLGYRDADGYVYLAGRKKEMIIRGGENIYPSEVEKTLLLAPGVREAAVVGRPDSVWGEVPVAAVVTDRVVSKDALIAFCKKHLASYKCPQDVIFLEKLSYNASGKVEKTKLITMFV